MNHPKQTELALLAGGELGEWRRWWIGRHLRNCPDCRDQVSAYQEARRLLRAKQAALPEDFDWDALAAEMTGNIRVGLAAGACVGPVAAPRAPRPRWHRAVLVAPLALPVLALVVVGLMYLRPRPQAEGSPWVEGTVVEATRGGIELRQGDRMLSLQHPGTGDVTYAVNTQGMVRARYVDEETGQVTIHNVYAQ